MCEVVIKRIKRGLEACLLTRALQGEWTPAKAVKVEGLLMGLVADCEKVSEIVGASYAGSQDGRHPPDYKVHFDGGQGRSTCYLKYKPARQEVRVWVGALYDSFPLDLADVVTTGLGRQPERPMCVLPSDPRRPLVSTEPIWRNVSLADLVKLSGGEKD